MTTVRVNFEAQPVSKGGFLARRAWTLVVAFVVATVLAAHAADELTPREILPLVQNRHIQTPVSAFQIEETFHLRDQPSFSLWKDAGGNWQVRFAPDVDVVQTSTYAIADRTRFRLHRQWRIPGVEELRRQMAANPVFLMGLENATRPTTIVGDGVYLWEELLQDPQGALQVARSPFSQMESWARMLQVKSIPLKDYLLDWREAIELTNQKQFDAETLVGFFAKDFRRLPDGNVNGSAVYVLERRNLPEGRDEGGSPVASVCPHLKGSDPAERDHYPPEVREKIRTEIRRRLARQKEDAVAYRRYHVSKADNHVVRVEVLNRNHEVVSEAAILPLDQARVGAMVYELPANAKIVGFKEVAP